MLHGGISRGTSKKRSDRRKSHPGIQSVQTARVWAYPPAFDATMLDIGYLSCLPMYKRVGEARGGPWSASALDSHYETARRLRGHMLPKDARETARTLTEKGWETWFGEIDWLTESE